MWLEFALRCGYLSNEDFRDLDGRYDGMCSSLVTMMTKAEQWCGPSSLVGEEEVPYDTPG